MGSRECASQPNPPQSSPLLLLHLHHHYPPLLPPVHSNCLKRRAVHSNLTYAQLAHSLSPPEPAAQPHKAQSTPLTHATVMPKVEQFSIVPEKIPFMLSPQPNQTKQFSQPNHTFFRSRIVNQWLGLIAPRCCLLPYIANARPLHGWSVTLLSCAGSRNEVGSNAAG